MSDDECKHGLDPRWCGVCIHGVSKPEPVTVETTFTARYDGFCGNCEGSFASGTRVSRLSNGRYVHESCA